ncbi:hypothetical protein C8N24_5596 [Solirubrobacter pauli]|uniref:Prenyltransferase/squalene oxidase-like repeat protein n=1 Tax=Solirubrobacter pauli TaxID=166793 RepID=A0A660L0Q8_9ACTN|nr:hypothetical protein [Solirubrobacter pauli]RKQ87571.1 hypothetical protein C8N24_5596 [Solirubrobacter pauli]
MIDRAEAYIWKTARVLEQRRFEVLFKGGDPEAVKAALEPYKTADGGYGYALEPDGRGPTSQPPHIWTALETLEDVGATDERVPDHLQTITASDGGVPVATPNMRDWPVAPWWAIGTEGSLLATALLYAPLSKHLEHPWLDGAEAFLWRQVDGIEKTHPYEVEAAITFLDAARDRERAQAAADRLGQLVREQELVGTQPEGYTVGEIHHPHDFAKSADSLARAWFSDAEIDASLDHLASRQNDEGGWDITWAVWTPAIKIEWSGLVTIAALKTLRSYGRV